MAGKAGGRAIPRSALPAYAYLDTALPRGTAGRVLRDTARRLRRGTARGTALRI